MKTNKKELAKDLLTGKRKVTDLMRPDGVVIQCGDKYRINTALGEQEVTLDQLNRIRGEEQTLIFLPERDKVEDH